MYSPQSWCDLEKLFHAVFWKLENLITKLRAYISLTISINTFQYLQYSFSIFFNFSIIFKSEETNVDEISYVDENVLCLFLCFTNFTKHYN